MTKQEIKLINGKKYLTHYDQESKKTIYCGSEENKESKVIKKEIELIDKQIESYGYKKTNVDEGNK